MTTWLAWISAYAGMTKYSVSRLPARALLRAARLLGPALVIGYAFNLPAHGFSSAPFFPLTNGYSWTYQENGFGSYTRTVQGPVVFNGATVMSLYYSPENNYLYFTNDVSGIRGHGAFYPNEFEPSCGTGETDVLQPFRYATSDITLGQVINDSGTGSASIGPCSFDLTYTSQSQIAAFETVSVPLGIFVALKVIYNRTVYYLGNPISSLSATYWLAQSVGVVKATETELIDDGFPYTYTLTATNVVRTAPDAFSFPPQTGVALNSTATSSAIMVTGTTAASPISITGGQYSFNGVDFTSASGTVTNGQMVTVRQTSSMSGSTTTNATLTIGGVSATFSVTTVLVPSHLLTVNVTGNGTVTSNPAGINCGATCSASYQQGTNVTLTATPGSGTPTFAGWSGGGCTGTGGCTVQVNAPTTVTATFVADTQAPTVPSGLTATPVSGSRINLAWSASSDNVGVTAYQVFRGGVFQATVTGATSFGDTGLAATTLYSYTVAACDAAGNCSAPSSAASATTLAAGQYYFEPVLPAGFTLLGNALELTLDVAALFGNQDPDMQVAGVTAYVESVWKWNSVQDRWAFYSPLLTSAGTAAYAASRGYEVLATIDPGEGYWVKATQPITLPAQSGTAYPWNGFSFSALPSGFNLISDARGVAPDEFNLQVTEPAPAQGVVPTTNFRSLWAWDAVQMKWYFYAPVLEASGGLDAVKAYTDSHNLLHFQDYGKTLGVGMGFWVNRP